MPDPRVSVIITVYDQEKYLSESIESVLDQDYRDFELIVVDDGSTDRSPEIARSFDDVKLIQQENRGHGAAMNAGIEHARGELLGFVDSDDKWEPKTLGLRVAKFDADPELEMLHGRLREFVSPELEAAGMTFARADGNATMGLVCGATLIKRASWLRVGPFDEVLVLGAYIEWMQRAREAGLRTAHHEDVVLHRRVHDANTTRRRADARSDYIRLAKRFLDRKRQMGEIDADSPAKKS